MSDGPWLVRLAHADDLAAAIDVQRDAFGRVAERLGIDPESLPALQESVEDLSGAVAGGTVVLVACSEERIVGSIRGTKRDDEVVEIGRLVVLTGYEGRGAGSALMREIENWFSSAAGFRLFTGADAHDTQRFYRNRGYVVTDIEDVGEYVIVWMSKPHVQPSESGQ